MGRPLKGPIRQGTSNVWFARVTVKPADRARAGCTRLSKSLETTDHTVALGRWPEAHKALKQELAIRLQTPLEDHDLIRARVNAALSFETPKGIDPLDSEEQAREVLNVRELDETNPTHLEVFRSIDTRLGYLTWEELLKKHWTSKHRKRGEPLSAATKDKTERVVQEFRSVCPFPRDVNRETVKLFVQKLEMNPNLKPSSVENQCRLIQSLITTAIRQDLIPIQTNPFSLVDVAGAIAEEDRRIPFNPQQLKELMGTDWGYVYRVLAGTGIRIGELLSRDLTKDLVIPNGTCDGERMLIVRKDLARGVTVKTKASTRRVPLDAEAVEAVERLFGKGLQPGTIKTRLNLLIREMYEDRRLVMHSLRHSYKTITRAVGVPAEISDEISGHAKVNTSQVADGYGIYPDSRLIKENKLVWEYLDNI